MSYIIPFLLISIAGAFEHEQAVHAKNFRGESQSFCTTLWVSAWSCKICCLALLIFVGIKLSWLAAIVMFVAGFIVPGILAGLFGGVAGRIFGPMGQAYVSLAAFLVWPSSLIAAYFTLPK